MKKRNKVLLTLILIIIIGIVLNNSIREYTKKFDMQNIIGSRYTGGNELSTKEFLALAEGTIKPYFKKLEARKI